MAQYCPHTSSCPFYGNWLDYKRDRRTDVIVFQGHQEPTHYDCLTLIALDDVETGAGIPLGEDLRRELEDLERIGMIKCPLNTLNGPNFLETKINDLVGFLK